MYIILLDVTSYKQTIINQKFSTYDEDAVIHIIYRQVMFLQWDNQYTCNYILLYVILHIVYYYVLIPYINKVLPVIIMCVPCCYV